MTSGQADGHDDQAQREENRGSTEKAMPTDMKSTQVSWLPLFDHDVVLVLSGHEQNYRRFGHWWINYVVMGVVGSAGLESWPHPERLAGELTRHLLVLDMAEEVVARA